MHVLVGFHDFLDAGEGERVVFEIGCFFNLVHLVGPKYLDFLLLLVEEGLHLSWQRDRHGREQAHKPFRLHLVLRPSLAVADYVLLDPYLIFSFC